MFSPAENIAYTDRPQQKPPAIIVCEPRSFEEATMIAKHLLQGSSVTIDVSKMDANLAQRAIDFIAGVCHTIGGNQERISELVLFFTPANTRITRPTAKPKALPPVAEPERSRWINLCSVLLG